MEASDSSDLRHGSEIKLPENLDVLIYMYRTPTYEAPFVARALQYNISADGASVREALESLLGLVKYHCQDALSRGSDPVCLAEDCFWKAFGLGVRVFEDEYVGVKARATRPCIRSLCELQEASGIYDIEELIKPAA